jgi:hypothetical protein
MDNSTLTQGEIDAVHSLRRRYGFEKHGFSRLAGDFCRISKSSVSAAHDEAETGFCILASVSAVGLFGPIQSSLTISPSA